MDKPAKARHRFLGNGISNKRQHTHALRLAGLGEGDGEVPLRWLDSAAARMDTGRG